MTLYLTKLDHYTHFDGRRIKLWQVYGGYLVEIVPVHGTPVRKSFTSRTRAREAYDAAVRGC